MRNIIVSFLASAWVLGSVLPAGAAVFWASPAGSDSNPGTIAKPWKSLQKAANSMRPGDTVLLMDGDYVGGARQRTSGTSSAPITFKAITPGKAIVRGDQGTDRDAFVVMESNWIVIDGLAIMDAKRAGIWVASSSNVTVKNCRALNNGVWGIFTSFSDDLVIESNEAAYSGAEHGIYVSNSADRPKVRYNLAHDNGKCGIQLNGDAKMANPANGPRFDGIIDGAVIDGNILYNNNRVGGAAINLACVHNGVVTNNLIYNNKRMGIALFNDNIPSLTQYGSKNNLIAANTIYSKPGEGGWGFVLVNGSTNNILKNNIIIGGARSAYEYDSSSSFRSDHNLIFSAGITFVATTNLKWLTIKDFQAQTGNDRNSVFAAAEFSDVAASDFRLRNGSPGKGAGVALLQVPTDLLGRAIPEGSHPDLGCYGAGDGELQAPPPVVGPAPVKTSISTANATIASGRTTRLRGTLKSGDNLVKNMMLTFKVDGATVGSATTNDMGLAVVEHVATENLGTHTITVEFGGDEAQYLPSSSTGTLTVVANTRIAPDRLKASAGSTVTFGATLTRADTGGPMAGRVITFFDGARVIGTAVTDDMGRAQITVTAPAKDVKYVIGMRFQGEGNFRACERYGFILGT